MGLSIFSIVGIILILGGMFVLLIFLVLFAGKRAFILGFSKDTRTATAEVVRFKEKDPYVINNLPANPIIGYYNEFKNRDVEEELIGTGIAKKDDLPEKKKNMGVDLGEKIEVEYVAWKARVIDPRFVDVAQYRLARYLIPIIVSAAFVLAGFFTLIIGIGVF